jgi:HNH endonuclease
MSLRDSTTPDFKSPDDLVDSEADPRLLKERTKGVADRKRRLSPLVCEVCKWGRGFESSLVGHHMTPIAKSGDPGEANVIVLCPNHHALAHKIRTILAYHKGRLSRTVTRQGLKNEISSFEQDPECYTAELKQVSQESSRRAMALLQRGRDPKIPILDMRETSRPPIQVPCRCPECRTGGKCS